VVYVLMIIAAAGMFYANAQFKSKGVPWGRPVAGILGLITVALAVTHIASILGQSEKRRQKIVDKDLNYANATMGYLGRYLAENFAGDRILLITSPGSEASQERHDFMVKQFEQALAGKLVILAEEKPGTSVAAALGGDHTQGDFIFTPESFDYMVKLHPECNLVVSLIGLPNNLKELKFWHMKPEKRPKLVVAFASVYELKTAIKMGFISAAITYNRSFKPNIAEELPDDADELFNQRYLLIDKKNIDRIATENPNMFMKEVETDDEEE
jgi:hypothetical protein